MSSHEVVDDNLEGHGEVIDEEMEQMGNATAAALEAAEAAAAWDAEEGRLLSYFFNNSEGNENNFNLHGMEGGIPEGMATGRSGLRHEDRSNFSFDNGGTTMGGRMSSYPVSNRSGSVSDGRHPHHPHQPPSTPAVQFYSPGGGMPVSKYYTSIRQPSSSASMPAQVESSSSSSSSLSSSLATSSSNIAASATAQDQPMEPAFDHDGHPASSHGHGMAGPTQHQMGMMMPPPPRLPIITTPTLPMTQQTPHPINPPHQHYPETAARPHSTSHHRKRAIHQHTADTSQHHPNTTPRKQHPEWLMHMSPISSARPNQPSTPVMEPQQTQPYPQPIYHPVQPPAHHHVPPTQVMKTPMSPEMPAPQPPIMHQHPMPPPPTPMPHPSTPILPPSTTPTPQTTTTTTPSLQTPLSPTNSTRSTKSTEPSENEERRARRLARNRESARQSRRRKKELLITLSEKVNQLNTTIENERRSHLNKMEYGLKQKQHQEIRELFEISNSMEYDDEELRQRLERMIMERGPNCPIRRAAVSFQYSSLKNLVLPRHHQFLLWLSMQKEMFFLEAKDERAKMTGRVSSKQIGEELTSAHHSIKGSASKKPVTSQVDNAMVFWPLLCYELTLSVDQEDRLVQASTRINEKSDLDEHRAKLSSYTKITSNLQRGVLFQSQALANRTQTTYLQILSPSQTAKLLNWFAHNRKRCQLLFDQKQKDEEREMTIKRRASLSSLCLKLNEMLKIDEESYGTVIP